LKEWDSDLEERIFGFAIRIIKSIFVVSVKTATKNRKWASDGSSSGAVVTSPLEIPCSIRIDHFANR